jgi:hypothetical protein
VHRAVAEGHVDIVVELLQAGADPTLPNKVAMLLACPLGTHAAHNHTMPAERRVRDAAVAIMSARHRHQHHWRPPAMRHPTATTNVKVPFFLGSMNVWTGAALVSHLDLQLAGVGKGAT